MYRLNFEAIGTKWEIEFDATANPELLKQQILHLCKEFETNFSRFIHTSEVEKLQNQTGIFPVSEEFLDIWKIYSELEELTQGKFTPLIGKLLNDRGYDSNYSFKLKSSLSFLPRLQEVVRCSGDQIEIRKPVEMDFGGIGKGFLIEKIRKLLESQGIENYLIEGSGDLYFGNQQECYQIGLENPFNSEEIIGACLVPANRSLCGSGLNKRAWGKHLSHIITPNIDLKNSSNKIASWVLHSNPIYADALATIVLLEGVDIEALCKHFGASYAILNEKMELDYSAPFPFLVI